MAGSVKIPSALLSVNRSKHGVITVIFAAATACNLSLGATTEGGGPFAAYTAAAQTRGILWTEMAPTPRVGTGLPTGPDSTPAVPIDRTDTPTGTPAQPCNRAQLLNDVNYPDGSKVPSGTTFTKIWRLKNLGSCTWTAAYSLVFDHGDQMGAPPSTPIALGMVPPGAETDVSVDLVAPASDGTYQGYFLLRSPEGQLFGIGGDGSQNFWVKIAVASPTSTNTPTIHFQLPPLNKSVVPLIFVGFSAEFTRRANCGVRKIAVFKVTNTGTLAIESLHIELQGPVGTTLLSSDQDKPFRSVPVQTFPQCIEEADESLNPGSAAYIRAIKTTLPGSGTGGRAVIKMCSQNGLAGKCYEVTTDFTW